MDRKQLALVGGAVAIAAVAIVFLLVTGGEDTAKAPVETTGDVEILPGENPPDPTVLADIEFAEVRREGSNIILEARLGEEIPKKLKGQSFDIRWDIEAPDPGKFIVSANLDVGANVALVGAAENNAFGSSTLDESFPGEFKVEGKTWTITIRADEVPDWPEEFTWKLTTSLDGDPGNPQSGRAEDHSPDAGFAPISAA